MAKNALMPGGIFILEAYTPRQIAFGTGFWFVVWGLMIFFCFVLTLEACRWPQT